MDFHLCKEFTAVIDIGIATVKDKKKRKLNENAILIRTFLMVI